MQRFLTPVRTESGEEITFHTILRELPGKRYSGLARWRGGAVFAKLFIGRRARVHGRREEAGLRALGAGKITTPALLHSGPAGEGYVVITEPIANALTCREIWSGAGDGSRIELLSSLAEVVARHHNAALRQSDMHLNNFIVAEHKIYSLDGAGIVSGQVDSKRALDNLALLLAQVDPRFDAVADSIRARYAKVRRWTQPEDPALLRNRIRKMRRTRVEEYLGKIFRECSAFRCESTFRRFVVYDRSRESAALLRLIAAPDSAFRGDILKNGRTSTVAKTELDSREVVVKRYNIKSFWHAVSRAPRRTRASASWKYSQLLCFLGIATAKPVALIEERWGPLRGTSYFIADYAHGPNIRDFLAEASPASRKEMIGKTVDLLRALESLNLSHGDLKASNIVVCDDRPLLLDLDAMREHRKGLRRALKRDAERLLANWAPESEIYKAFQAELRQFLE